MPLCFLLFSSVFGLAVNLRLAVFDWQSETSVVKQIASLLIDGLGGFVLCIAGAALCRTPRRIWPMGFYARCLCC